MATSLIIEGTTYAIGQNVDEISKVSGAFIDAPEQMKGIVTGTISTTNNANDKLSAGKVISIKPTNIQIGFSINANLTAGATDITRRILEDAMNKGLTVGLVDDKFYDSAEYGNGSYATCLITDCNFRRSGKESDKGQEIIAQVTLREIYS